MTRVPAASGMFRPVARPELIVPSASVPVSDGVNVTSEPGIAPNELFGVVEAYN